MLAHCMVCYSHLTCVGNVACHYAIPELMDKNSSHNSVSIFFFIQFYFEDRKYRFPHPYVSLSLFIIATMYLVVIFYSCSPWLLTFANLF